MTHWNDEFGRHRFAGTHRRLMYIVFYVAWLAVIIASLVAWRWKR